MGGVVMGMLGWLAMAGQAAEPLRQFSADQVMNVGGRVMNSRLFVDGSNLRTEMQVEGAGPVVSIVNGEKHVVWMLMPGNLYLEKSLASDDDPSRMAWAGDPGNREHLGTETVNGLMCDKYRLKGQERDLTFYTEEKTGYPVLMTIPDQSIRVEWKQVKPGPQPAALFQVPAGYTKLSMPALPGGLKLPGMK